MSDDIEPIPADHPHLADDPIYQAMDPEEQFEHRLMLARMWGWQREEAERRAANPRKPKIDERILAALERIDEKLAVLERIDAKLATLIAVARERR
jgi:hypothetical protein